MVGSPRACQSGRLGVRVGLVSLVEGDMSESAVPQASRVRDTTVGGVAMSSSQQNEEGSSSSSSGAPGKRKATECICTAEQLKPKLLLRLAQVCVLL